VRFGVLQNYNASAHMALSVRELLASKQITVLEKPTIITGSSPQLPFYIPEGKGNIERKSF
jgi:hypothetical protein